MRSPYFSFFTHICAYNYINFIIIKNIYKKLFTKCEKSSKINDVKLYFQENDNVNTHL